MYPPPPIHGHWQNDSPLNHFKGFKQMQIRQNKVSAVWWMFLDLKVYVIAGVFQ
jgi:hypothetical protein